MMEPQVLLFDEPTAALGYGNLRDSKHYSRAGGNEDITRVIVTHEVEIGA